LSAALFLQKFFSNSELATIKYYLNDYLIAKFSEKRILSNAWEDFLNGKEKSSKEEKEIVTP
jgi:hypothetical protein